MSVFHAIIVLNLIKVLISSREMKNKKILQTAEEEVKKKKSKRVEKIEETLYS